MTDRATLRASILGILTGSAGLSPDNVADAIVTAVCGPVTEADLAPSDPLPEGDPAVTGIPRDETHDSIDAASGTLTDAAIAKRAADQAELDAADAEVAKDDAALADAQSADEAAHTRQEAAQATLAEDDKGADTQTGADPLS